MHARGSPNDLLHATILDESFLENLNCVLNAGDVPNLYENEDKERIMQGMRNKVSSGNGEAGEGSASFDKVFARYVSEVRENFRLALALSPAGSRFRERCRNFPSLVNCSTIDWYEPWPTGALEAVAGHFLFEEVERGGAGADAAGAVLDLDDPHAGRILVPRAELRSFEPASLAA